VPLSEAAKGGRIADMSSLPQLTIVDLSLVTGDAEVLAKKTIAAPALAKINEYIAAHEITRAYVGVPSPDDEEKAFKISEALAIPFALAYEFMFRAPEVHAMWKYLPILARREQADFLVPLPKAKDDIGSAFPIERIHTIGHLSIDRALSNPAAAAQEKRAVKQKLSIEAGQELVFISSSTQALRVDCEFLEVLLAELSTGRYPNLQLRLGLHPGIKDLDTYLETVLGICARYADLNKQFKIIFPKSFEDKLTRKLAVDHPFISRIDISGPELLKHSDKAAQSVPGALPNEAALNGEPSYFNVPTTPYLPAHYFAENVSAFFSAKPVPARDRTALGLEGEEAAADKVSAWMLK
jgi:hypothetical protein